MIRKASGFRLQATVVVVGLILAFLLPTACCLSPVQATESTPSADIKSKLIDLEKEIASRAAKLKQQISVKLSNKAYVGKIKVASKNTITIATINGPKLVNTNQDTVFESDVKGKKYSQKLISEEDYIASLGDVDETGVLTAKKIVYLPTPNSELKTYLWGQIIAISGKLITLKDKDSKSHAVSIDDSSTIKISDFVIFTGVTGKNDIFEAEFVYVIPQGGILKAKKPTTPSAELKTSASVSPSPKTKNSK